MFHFENPKLGLFFATVENRFVRGLCTPAVLIFLELFSKRTGIIPTQITNLASTELAFFPAQIRNSLKCVHFKKNIGNLFTVNEKINFFKQNCSYFSGPEEELRVLFIKS
jgi:hypothetical protein